MEEYSRIDSFDLLRYAYWFDRISDYWEYHYPILGGKIFYNQDLWHIPKPRYKRWAKYDALMEEYRRLQKEYETVYHASLMKAFDRINKLLG